MKAFILKNIYIFFIVGIIGLILPVAAFAKNFCFSFPDGLSSNQSACFSIPDIPNIPTIPSIPSDGENKSLSVFISSNISLINNKTQTNELLDITMSGFQPNENVDIFLNGQKRHTVIADINGTIHFTSKDASDITNLSNIHVVGQTSKVSGDWGNISFPTM